MFPFLTPTSPVTLRVPVFPLLTLYIPPCPTVPFLTPPAPVPFLTPLPQNASVSSPFLSVTIYPCPDPTPLLSPWQDTSVATLPSHPFLWSKLPHRSQHNLKCRLLGPDLAMPHTSLESRIPISFYGLVNLLTQEEDGGCGTVPVAGCPEW
ncbi:hypothetical protein Pcinc_042606 [Petrolisthes cinctipes]|uniref:Uncharacterized protein n=1 Tax=Petrolisthes cinctipes TaxID=88211 RepID=A0AAE1BH56_PETCI|nr:hypothetical protein Pcinc_042606 [Petrolisthes cinctipes]